MKHRVGLAIIATLSTLQLSAQTTIEQCQLWAQKNYPLINRYELIDKSTEYSLSNASRAWIPQVTLTGQASYQSAVAAFPESMLGLYQQAGIEVKGLNKDQYKAGVEVAQTIWDGGATKAQKSIDQSEGAISKAQNDVDLYALNGRVNTLFFAILLLDEQLTQNEIVQQLLQENLKTVKAYYDNGVAMKYEVDAIEAELLTTMQQHTQLSGSAKAYRNMLSIFTGREIKELEVPSIPVLSEPFNQRPELNYFDRLDNLYQAQLQGIKSSTMPRINLSFNGFYGNPGLDLFKDMIDNKWSWNYIAGINLQWRFGAFYTKKNSIKKVELNRKSTQLQRETFLFNSSMQESQQRAAIDNMQQILAKDNRIIELRESVRKAYEAKLENGVIQVVDLLREVSTENQARVTEISHRIELLKDIYELKNTLNN